MEDPIDRLEEARKQIVIAAGAISDDDHLDALQEARRLIDDVRADGDEGRSQGDRPRG